MIIQEEGHRSIARDKDEREDAIGFSTQVVPKAAAVRTKERVGTCKHCGKTGHEETECFQVIGYPDWWGDRPKGNNRGQSKERSGGIYGRGRGAGSRVMQPGYLL